MPKGSLAPSQWLLGYIEGVSDACLVDPPVASGLDTRAVFERLDHICRSRPDWALSLAAEELITQLDPEHRDLITLCHAPRPHEWLSAEPPPKKPPPPTAPQLPSAK
jgi:hypothetical protein